MSNRQLVQVFFYKFLLQIMQKSSALTHPSKGNNSAYVHNDKATAAVGLMSLSGSINRWLPINIRSHFLVVISESFH